MVVFFFDFKIGRSISILPNSLEFKLFKIFPSGPINALTPLFADLIVKAFVSIDLKIAFEKCCSGPTLSPNQASSEIFTIKLNCLILFSTSLGKIIS